MFRFTIILQYSSYTIARSFCITNMSNPVIKKRIVNASLLEYANKNRNEGFFSDITIQANDKSIPANRLVLSCYSPFFERMFKSSMRERYEAKIEIQIADGQTLTDLIEYIYVGSITIGEQNVMSILSGADYLQLDDVKQFCFDFLESNIKPETSLEIFKAAALYRNVELKKKAQQYIGLHLDQIAQTDDFKNLSQEDLNCCITNLNQNRTVASSLYKSILVWTHQAESRKAEFFEFLKRVNLNKLSMDFLEKVVLEEALVLNCMNSKKLALQVFHNSLQNYAIKLNETTKVIRFGGKGASQKVSVVYSCLNDEESRGFPDLNQELYSHSALKTNDYVYLLGGKTKKKGTKDYHCTSNVWQLHLKEKTLAWKQVANMQEKRSLMGAAVYRDTLVVAGGFDEKSILASAEYYSYAFNEWKFVQPMNQCRGQTALVTCKGHLYALGGNDGKNCLSSVERLESLKGVWEMIQPMQTQRIGLAAVNCNGTIYAIGGKCDGTTKLKSVEKYDSATNQWKYVSDMNKARNFHCACVLRGKIYVIGGYNVDGKLIKDIDCYDTSTDKWAIAERAAEGFGHHAIITL